MSVSVEDAQQFILDDLRKGQKKRNRSVNILKRLVICEYLTPLTLQEEVLSLSAKMLKDKNIAADISIVPIAQSRVKISEVMNNIKSVRATKLYNLCSSIVKTNDIAEIDDIMIRNYIALS